MRKRILVILSISLTIVGIMTGCRQRGSGAQSKNRITDRSKKTASELNSTRISPDKKITELEKGLSAVRYDGDYGFDDFLKQGGAASDEEVVKYLSDQLSSSIPELIFGGNPFGCSTLSVKNTNGGNLFGRNFDWQTCDGLIISSHPDHGYASVSTVNMDFI